MKKTSLVFFGSGPVADESLGFLLKTFDVEAVITKPKPDHHRGHMPTIELCKEKDIAYHTPSSKAELSKLFETQNFRSEVGVVIDYGIIISQSVIDYFAHGIVNSHFSLLPEWRGADPITYSILSGQGTTGVSLMLINDRMDEGPIIAQESLRLVDNETSETLTTKLVQLSNLLLSIGLPNYLDGSLKPMPQSGQPTYSHKLTKQDGLIDWTKHAEQIEREVRAYHAWPRSYTKLGNNEVIIRSAKVVEEQGTPGNIEQDKRSLMVFCGKDALAIETIQPAGKKEMPVQAFLAGYKI